ncbi:MAG: YihY/virulence factor BrkB family protein [Bacteroidaceae bacterium]|nr:YihY/virulence factor BrkB family protein [Bacteroidaceae bacterium]
MNWMTKIYNHIRRFTKRWYVKYYRRMGEHRISWSLIKLIESFSKLQLSSAALTYHTVFAIVPVMALMIAVAKGLGYDEMFVQQVRSIFQGQEIISDSLLQYANSYLSNTKVAMWLGIGIGLALLLYSVFSIFSTIDATFNMLWNQKGRSFGKLLKTFAFVLVLPFAVVMALALWWSVSSIFSDSVIKELNVLIISVSTYILVLFAAYKLIPNTKVKANYAALSAVVCGLIFAAMQYFSYYIISLFNYRSIYGDLASLMIFILLIYFSWTVCLAGSKWNYFLQMADEHERENDYRETTYRYHKFLCLLILERIESVHPFEGHFKADELAANAEATYGLPTQLTKYIINYLHRKKIIFTGKSETLHLSKRYSGYTIGKMYIELDGAGRNKDTIDTLSKIHSNTGLSKLWNTLNNASPAETDKKILETPVHRILDL